MFGMDGMELDGMGLDGMGLYGIRWDGIRWDEMHEMSWINACDAYDWDAWNG